MGLSESEYQYIKDYSRCPQCDTFIEYHNLTAWCPIPEYQLMYPFNLMEIADELS